MLSPHDKVRSQLLTAKLFEAHIQAFQPGDRMVRGCVQVSLNKAGSQRTSQAKASPPPILAPSQGDTLEALSLSQSFLELPRSNQAKVWGQAKTKSQAKPPGKSEASQVKVLVTVW